MRVLILTNTRQADRFRTFKPKEAPDPSRERRILAANGVDAVLYDRGRFPWNPLAQSDILYAGLDPLRALRILLFERHADLVLCVFENTAFVLCLLRRLFRFKPPIVLMEVSGRGWKPRDIVLDIVMPQVDQIIVLTRRQAQYVRQTYRTKNDPIVLDWVVDELFYAPLNVADKRYILSVGEDISRDFASLIAACADIDRPLILKTTHDVSIPDTMRDRVQVIKARLSPREFRHLYAGAAVVVVPLSPTDHPGGISTVLEAMAMGRPVVASETGTTCDLLESGESGILVPPSNAAMLRDAVLRVLSNNELAERLGRKARQRVEAIYSMDVRHKKLAELLKSFVRFHQ